MSLKIEYIEKEKLRPYANNAKAHPAEQVEQIKDSIEKFGFNDPVAVWKDNEVIEGHGRLLAAMEMDDIDKIPVIRLDKLTDEQRRAYGLIHNQLTMNSGWDFDILNLELMNIEEIDMEDFGFSTATLDFVDFEEAEESDHSKRMNSTIVSVIIGFAKFEIEDPDHSLYEATKKMNHEKAGQLIAKLLKEGAFE